jgi:hypothetical protein
MLGWNHVVLPINCLFTSYRILSKRFILILTALPILAACASAPVQEMSDARQAIRAAEAAGARLHSPQQIREAYWLLEKAQKNLESRDYLDAKRFALDARDKAIQTQESLSNKANSSP